jgi:formylglycine-generating enzyme required for sulfatase activity/tRNA A-37 threonylcarbamoyl transferase component Bud32
MALCPSAEQLQRLLADQLNGPEGRVIESHVQACPACQEALEQLTAAADGPVRSSAAQDSLTKPPEDAPEDFLRRLQQLAAQRTWAGAPPEDFQETLRTDGAGPVGASSKQPVIAGYEILGELGRGGMGVVYKARQRKANRLIALKMILGSRHASLQDKVRFQIEVEAVARLQHPNIVQLYEAGEQGDLPFFSLELCEGGSLDHKLGGKPLPPRAAAELAEKLARAMHYAHARGVIHRDLKPANVLLTADGVPKITDFGLAKRTDRGGNLSLSGTVMGTPSYMAPEQAAGKSRDVGPAADIYALGAILYELLTGGPPFKEPSAFQTMQRVLAEEPDAPSRRRPGTPGDLDVICLKCLQKDPRGRYPTALALAEDLRCFLAGEPITARPAGALERSLKWARRRPAAAGLLVASAALVVLVIVSLVVVSSQLSATRAALEREEDAHRQRAKAEKSRALARVEALRDAAPGAVPAILADLQRVRDDVLPRLRELWKSGAPACRFRIALALLPVDPEAVRDELAAWLLHTADPAEVLLARDALLPYRDALRERFWSRAEAPTTQPAERFRALVALAAFDPENERWVRQAPGAVGQMLAADPLYLAGWMNALRPVRAMLAMPLAEVFRTAEETDRRALAATVLADYAADRPDFLADLLLDADARQYALLYPLLEERFRVPTVERMRREVRGEGLVRRPRSRSDQSLERLAQRQATTGVTLMKLGLLEDVWPLFRHRPDPEVRSQLIHRAGLLAVDMRQILHRLEEEKDVSARRALILTLGEATGEQVPEEVRAPLCKKLLTWFREDPDPGIHAALDWLLRHDHEGSEARPFDWNQVATLRQIDATLRRPGPEAARRWYVNGQGQTLIVIPGPVEFRMGSPSTEAGRRVGERAHRRLIERSFVIASKPVTVEEFQRFLRERPDVRHIYTRSQSPDPQGPIIAVTWFQAAQYCNWLSEQEGLPPAEWCYPNQADIKEGMHPNPNYLRRTGYRLPTEAEWEYAARAGSAASRFFGSSPELLPRYAWFMHNAEDRTWPVGQKRPNDLGLFDVLGNVWNWVSDRREPYPGPEGRAVVRDEEDAAAVGKSQERILRGGSFWSQPVTVRLAYRNSLPPSTAHSGVGFRVGRTLP